MRHRTTKNSAYSHLKGTTSADKAPLEANLRAPELPQSHGSQVNAVEPAAHGDIQYRSLYAAFDRFPLPKGASTHIKQMASTLFKNCGNGLLYVAGDKGKLPLEFETLQHDNRTVPVTLIRSQAPTQCAEYGNNNVLAKAMAYADQLSSLLQRHGQQLQIAHFRDPWAGVPLLDYRTQQPQLRLVYEVNALPSIELPTHLAVKPQTLAVIKAWEQRCLDGADLILTPSKLTQQQLKRLTNTPIHYLPNGAEPITQTQLQEKQQTQLQQPPSLIYFGGAQRWQGLTTLLHAMVIIKRQLPATLTLCLSLKNRQARQLTGLIASLNLTDVVKVHYGLSQAELRPKIINATASVAPLIACERNMLQGCCPLKIVESMAAATPVIASDLPVVHELLAAPTHGLLVPPYRPSELARACISLLSQPELAAQMGQRARAHIVTNFQWNAINQTLSMHYQQLLSLHSSSKRIANECLASTPV